MAEFNKRVLKNGLTILAEKRNQPSITIFAAMKQGAANEKASEKGISHFLEHMLFKGTKKRTSKDISSSIEKTGGVLNGFTDEEVTAFYVKVPSKHLELGVDILADMVQNPRLSIPDIEQERKVILEEIKMLRDLPQDYVTIKLFSLLYSAPFGTTPIGSFETVGNINRQKLLNLHAKYMPKNLILAFVGNVPIDDIERLANRKFLFKNKMAQTLQPQIMKISAQLIEKRPNLDQAHIAIGFHMPTAIDKLKFAAEVFNSNLSDGMSSKLFQEIREKRGLAYSVNGTYTSGKKYGLEIIYAGTSPKNVNEVKRLIFNEVKKMRNITLGEVEETKEKLIGGFELSREKSEQVAKGLIYEELAHGAEEYYKFIENISRVKLSDVKKISKIKNYSSAILLPK
jgi:predicted Zn-dependent peptidase